MIVCGTAGTGNHRELQGESLQRLQLKLEGKVYLIVYETKFLVPFLFKILIDLYALIIVC